MKTYLLEMGREAGLTFVTSNDKDMQDIFIAVLDDQWEHGWRDIVRHTVETALCPAGDRKADIRLPQDRPTQSFEVEACLV